MTYRTLAAHTIASVLVLSPMYLSAAELQSPLAFSSFSELVEALLRSIVYIALPIISLFVSFSYDVLREFSLIARKFLLLDLHVLSSHPSCL
jgi:hypothetical protein